MKENNDADSINRTITVARVLRGKAKKREGNQFEPEEFTNRIATPVEKRWTPQMEWFSTPPEFEKLLEKSI